MILFWMGGGWTVCSGKFISPYIQNYIFFTRNKIVHYNLYCKIEINCVIKRMLSY